MDAVLHMSGGTALLVVCAVLFAEECGVPLPFLPGDLLLVGGGLMAASGRLSAPLCIAATTLAMCAGAVVSHAWSGAVGVHGLRRVAVRLRIERHVERATGFIREGGATGVLVGRLLPGCRVYTNMAAGAAGIERGAFIRGLVPSVLAWTVGFVTLGRLVGRPLERWMGHAQHGTGVAALVALGALTAIVAARFVPPRGTTSFVPLRSPGRRALAATIDVGLVLAAVEALVEASETIARLDGWDSLLAVTLACCACLALYVTLTRRLVGRTAGEVLLGVTYRAADRRTPLGDG